MNMRRNLSLMVAVLLVAVTGTACGDDSDKGSSGNTKINIQLSPVVDGAPVFYAVSKGIFAKHGLDVTASQAVSGGPAMIPTLLNGQIQLGGTGPGTLAPVWAQGLPVKYVAPLSFGGTDDKTAQERLIATPKSGVKTLADLPGKTIAVPTLNNMGQITISNLLEKNGIDPKSVKYIAVPYVEQQAALQSGSIDIAFTTEPYFTQIQTAMPFTVLGAPGPSIGPSLPNFMVVGVDSYVNAHKKEIREFQLAIQEATDFLSKNPDQARQFAKTFTKIDDATIAKVVMPVFSNDPNIAGLQKIMDTAQKYGVIGTKLDVSKFVIPYPLPA